MIRAGYKPIRMLALKTIVAAMLIASAAAQDTPVGNQSARTFRGKSTEQFELKYLLFLPDGYEKTAGKKWPLMLFLHGAGERGTNLSRVAVHGPPKIVQDRKDFPFILVSPQCPAGKTWSNEALLGLLDEVIERENVDRSRVYLTGLSMGGYGTWSLAIQRPDRFAAIAPICGGGNTLGILLPEPDKQARLRQLPIWAFHGAKDMVVPLVESERMVNAFKRRGNEKVKLTVYPEAGHDSWTETYADPDLYDWLLQHKLEPVAR